MRLSANLIKEKVSFLETVNGLGFNYIEGYSNECPFCNKKKLSVNDSYAFCFMSGCEANTKHDIFSWLISNGLCSSFNEAYRMIAEYWNLDTNTSTTYIPSRPQILERVFKAYNEVNSIMPYEYLLNRGYRESMENIPIGYSDSFTYLKDRGFTNEELDMAGLLSKNNCELFYSHIIFPIRDYQGKLRHLQGRIVGDAEGTRWINSKGEQNQTINYFLFNEDNAYGQEKLYLTEGISDGFSLMELVGIDKVVSCFGTSPSLDTHNQLFSNVKELVTIFDNDRTDLTQDEDEKLKSWKNILPKLILLKIKFNQINIKCIMPPRRSGIKDINDWYKSGLSKEEILNNEKRALSLFDFIFKYHSYKDIHNSILHYLRKIDDYPVKEKMEELLRSEKSLVEYINAIKRE